MLSRSAFGNSLAAHLAHYKTVSGALGLAGQIAFAAFPVIQLRLRSDWLIPLANNPTHSARAATDLALNRIPLCGTVVPSTSPVPSSLRCSSCRLFMKLTITGRSCEAQNVTLRRAAKDWIR